MSFLLIWIESVVLCTESYIQYSCVGYEVCSCILRVHIWYPIKQSLCYHRRLEADIIWFCWGGVAWSSRRYFGKQNFCCRNLKLTLAEESRIEQGMIHVWKWYHIMRWLQCLQWPILWRWFQVTVLCQLLNLSEHYSALCCNKPGKDLLVWRRLSVRKDRECFCCQESWQMIAFASHLESSIRG